MGPTGDVDFVDSDGFGARSGAFDWTRRQVAALAAERRPLDYEAATGCFDKTLDPDDGHPMGRLVRICDPCRSAYRIEDGVITQVESTLGRDRLVLTVQVRGRICDGRSVPLQFTIGHFDSVCGTLVCTETFCDNYVGIHGALLPASRQVLTIADSNVTIGRIRFEDHELLSDSPPGPCPHMGTQLARWPETMPPPGLVPSRN